MNSLNKVLIVIIVLFIIFLSMAIYENINLKSMCKSNLEDALESANKRYEASTRIDELEQELNSVEMNTTKK